MKENLKLWAVGGLVLLSLAWVLASLQKSENPLGSSYTQGFPFNTVSTTTLKNIPGNTVADNTILLSNRPGRIYAAVVNDCSSSVYLFFATTTDHVVHQVPDNNLANGLRLNANGGSYEILLNENRYTGSVTASSTADCNVYVTEQSR